MPANREEERSEQYETLFLLADSYRGAASVVGDLLPNWNDMELSSVLEKALVDKTLTEEELLRLWAVSLLFAQIAKRLYLASLGYHFGAGKDDTGHWETAP